MSTFPTIQLRDFDKGLIDTFGSELIDFSVDGGVRQVYAKEVPALTTNIPQFQGKVPVFFAYPEDVFQNHRIPCFVVRRTSLNPAFDRAPFWGYQKKPTLNANPLTVQQGQTVLNGYDSYTTKWNAVPFNIGYDIQLFARTQSEGLFMLLEALKVFRPPFFTAYVSDSHGDRRGYDAGEVSVSEASEINDIVSRLISWTISFEIRGELDLDNEVNVGSNNGLITNFIEIMTELHTLEII